MAVTTVRPNATASGTGLFVITGGPTNFQEALSDDSDTSYISKSSSIVGPASAILDFGTLTLSATQRVKQVRIRARCSTPTATGQLNVYLGSRIDNQNYFHSALAVRGENSSATTFTGPYFNASPNGEEWTQAAINGLRGKITEYNDTSAVASIYELYVDVDVAAQPSTTVTAPTGTITTTTAPDVSWTFSDTDNETQAFYEIKIFNDGVYTGGGFSPDTSTADWSSGEVASSDNTAVVGTLLLPDVYRAYVRTAKAINGQPFWSAWAFAGFTISYTAPSIPSMVVNWSATLGRAAFTLTGTAPSGYASQYFDIHRSDDNGTIYEGIRNGGRLIPNGSYVATAVDYEAPRSLVAYYRCRSVGVDSNDNEFPSAWGTVQQILITNDDTWWFKAVENPSLNKGGLRVQGDIEIAISEPNTVFRRLGEDRPVVVAGPLQGQDGRYLIKTLSETEWNDLLALIEYQGTLLVQDPFGNQKYIRITNRNLVEINAGGNIYRDVLLEYVEVES